MLIRRSGVLAALVAALFVAGCARSTTGSDSTGTPGTPGSVSAGAPRPDGSTSAGATGSVSRGTPGSAPPSEEHTGTKPPAATGSETLSGTVTAGVEPNCLLLTGNGPAHLLLFEDPSLRPKAQIGASITVVGTAAPTQLTTCQQGIPFIVTSVSVD
ncbi:MAG TPA: hypothetical protein VGQ92_15030 [Actinoplanes sp.]|jgi:hypothetical protein|nr:hypothetical protein [Actinoplanes sp.]